MTIADTIIFSAFGGLIAAIIVLWRLRDTALVERIARLEVALTERDKQIADLWTRLGEVSAEAEMLSRCPAGHGCPLSRSKPLASGSR